MAFGVQGEEGRELDSVRLGSANEYCSLKATLMRASAGALHPHHSNRLLYLHIPTIVNTHIQHMGGELVFGGLGGEEGGELDSGSWVGV